MPSPASAPASVVKTVSLRLSRADIYTVINEFQHQTNLNVAVLEGDQPYRLINVYLDHATPDQALRYIAASAGGTLTLQSDGVYLIHPQSSQDTASVSGPNDAASLAPGQSAQPAPQAAQDAGPITIHKIPLHFVSPADILDKMGWTADVHPGPDSFVGSPNTQPGSVSNSDPHVNVITTPPMVNNYAVQQPSVPAGQGTTGPDQANDYSQANRSINPGDTSNQANQFGFPGGGGGFGGGGFGGGGFGGGGFGGGGFGGPGGFQRGGPGGPGGGFGGGPNGAQRNVLPDGVDHIYGIEGDNSLLVFATQQGYETVRQIVNYLDVEARQVEIKVEFVTATVRDVDQFGINFSLVPSPTSSFNGPIASQNPGGTTGTGVVNTGSTYLQFAYGNVAAQLYDLVTKTRSKVVAAPIISTTNNVPAYITFVNEIPYTIPVTTIVPNGGTITNNIQNFETLSTLLFVTPRINNDDTVTLNLTPTITTPVGGATSTTGVQPFDFETLSATRTVKSGQTMVLGGLVNKTEAADTARIPILSSLPIIGGLFKSHSVDNTDQELLIFVTPTIISENDSDSGDTSQPQNDVGVNAVPGAVTP